MAEVVETGMLTDPLASSGGLLTDHRALRCSLLESNVKSLMARLLASRDPAPDSSFALSTALGELFKPGETVHGVLQAFAGMLQQTYEAALCVVTMEVEGEMRLCLSGSHGGQAQAALLSDAIGDLLEALRQEPAALLSGTGHGDEAHPCQALDEATLEPCGPAPVRISRLVERVGALCFMSVPLKSRSETLGRLHLFWKEARRPRADLHTLVQLARQAGPSIESMLLVERLSETVATVERRRISRDLHDGTIQPYIGLKLGLEALRRRLPSEAALSREVDELIAMAGDGIMQLRRYVGCLKGGATPVRPGRLLPALREQAEKFTRYNGIRVDVLAPPDLEVGVRLHGEVLNMVREALSNVRRHTCALRATIAVRCEDGHLVLEVVNDDPHRAELRAGFHPHSIVERAEDLGGRVRIERRLKGQTAVRIELPL